MSIRWKHVLVYLFGGMGCWLFLWIWNRENIENFRLETMRKSLTHDALLMELLFKVTDSTLDSEVDEIRKKIHYRITIVDREGRVLADSAFSGRELAEMGNQLSFKEVAQAAREGVGTDLRFTPEMQAWYLYAAVPLSNNRGFIRLGMPVSAMD